MQDVRYHDQSRRGLTLAPGEFLGARRLLRAQVGWRAYKAIYPPSFQCGMHDHERAALCMVVSGRYREMAGARSTELSAGSIVQQPAGNHHADQHGVDTVELLIVEFDPTALVGEGFLRGMVGERASRSDASTTRLVARLGRELEAADAVAPLACEAIILEAVVALARAAPLAKDRAPSWLRLLDERISDFTAPLPTLAELATGFGLHPAHLARVFRQHRGMSIGEHRRRIMIDEARRQIEHTDAPLAAIAASVGFADQSHMTRLFTAWLGRSPAKFRSRFDRPPS